MTLTHIIIFSGAALLIGWALPARWRSWAILGSSVAAIYWLQSSIPIRNLDFWLPTAALLLTVLVWVITQPELAANLRGNWISALVILLVVLVIGLTRYFEPLCCLTPSRPPDLLRVALALGLGSIVAAAPARFFPRSRILPGIAIFLIIGLFIILKTGPLALAASSGLRIASGQDTSLASPLDLRWLGFSYLAFRLLHALRDYQAGKLPAYSLGEFITYAIFFPAYTAGPIDRSQHFIPELRGIQSDPQNIQSAAPERSSFSAWLSRLRSPAVLEDLVAGSQRILWGVFKKFVLADSLALFALNAQNASQANSGLWLWVLLYAYALRIYFDFSGYTDIAIGLGRLMGFHLPENFDRPYLKQNLTAFWNSWHITLAQWFRAYFFYPTTRALRTGPRKLPAWAVILIGQMGTMLLIGLWHGITWNFIAWGAWHGIGLYVHNRWSEWIRPRQAEWANNRQLERTLRVGSWLLTFHFVVLGWVWFALPDPSTALLVFQKLIAFR